MTFWTNVSTNGLPSPEQNNKTKKRLGRQEDDVKMMCFPIIPSTFSLFIDFIRNWFWEKKISSFHPWKIVLYLWNNWKGLIADSAKVYTYLYINRLYIIN